MKQVAVVVPRYREPLPVAERLSLAHLGEYLAGYDRYYIVPETLEFNEGSFAVERFDDRWFRSVATFNRLLLDPRFYERFDAYRYILIHQLDALVFQDSLDDWCHRGFDYVGAPWFHGFEDQPKDGFWLVGNGGFSLRKTSSHLEVLQATSSDFDREAFWRVYFDRRNGHRRWLRPLRPVLDKIGPCFGCERFLDHFQGHEDIFWSMWAQAWKRDFAIPEPEEALSFAFEAAPDYCFERNGRELPFGCHDWEGFDPAFWEPYLRRDLLRETPA